ncbi:hypothetical protein [Streptomyces sp. NRRL S-1448]|uniref:hypothetical protein n=1 Tax=Streptomyces sp. NRRL S-1448 TaxID=1463883 RepID=UPI00068BBC31|nr:hypothetical protein [Streptomyces sp. NRRL S-1448]
MASYAARLAGGDWHEARAASPAIRTAITSPAVRVAVLLPSLADTAKAAADATYATRNAAEHAALDTARARGLVAGGIIAYHNNR